MFAQQFVCMNSSSGYSYPGWAGTAPTGIMDTLASTLGAENVWWCDYTDDELASATEDLTVILNGGTLGGGSESGSGTVVTSNYVLIQMEDWAPSKPAWATDVTHVAIKSSLYNELSEYAAQQDEQIVVIFGGERGASPSINLYTAYEDTFSKNDGDYSFSWVRQTPFMECTEGVSQSKVTTIDGYTCIALDATNSQRTGMAFPTHHGNYPIYMYSINAIVTDTGGSGSGSGGGSGGSGSGSGGGGSGTDVPDDDLDWPEPTSPTIDFDFDTSDIVYVLSQILADMRNLDRSTNDLVDLSGVISAINNIQHPTTDLSGINDYLSRILTALGEVSGIDFNGINGMLAYVHNDLMDTNDTLLDIETAIGNISIPSAPDLSGIGTALSGIRSDLSDIETAIGNISIPSPPDLSGIRSDLADIETAIGNISIPAAPNLTGIQTAVEDILDELQHAEYSTDMTRVEDLLSTNNARLGSIITAINGLDIPVTDLTETLSAIDDVADACTDIYTDIHAYFAEMLGYWDGIDDTFVTFFTSWTDWVTDWSGKWSSLMTKLDQIYRRLGKKPWTGDVVGDPGVTLPDPGTDIVPIGDDDIGFPLPHFDWDELAPILHIPALKAAILELMSKFPFCMLNEIVTIGGYMLRQPMTPVFDLPAPNPSDWSHPHLVHIDLSDFDQCAAVLRTLIMMWAAVRISNKTIRMWMGDKEVY